MPERPWPILVAGTITRDTVRTPMGFNADGLGGSATYFTLAARLFAPVHVVATVGPDFREKFETAVRHEGVDLRAVIPSDKPTYRWIATHDYRTGTTSSERSEQGAYERFEPALLPEQRRAPVVFLGSMQPRYQTRVLDQLEAPAVVAGDTMRLYIREQRRELESVLPRLDYLILNGIEAMALAECDSVHEAVARLRDRYELRGLLIKEGPRGATLYTGASTDHVRALPVDPPVDPTGAGDAVAGGFLGYLAEQRREDRATLLRAMSYAMVMASFAIQQFSVAGLRSLTRADVESRMRTLTPA
ncbi:MAG TPA: PfkB family carbohydrate kinase [Candidatus Limnocylindrales bacterium]|nr:PfkB family carbohydrate kinase [Candidatus Limnocylindrales bacterium]